MGRRTTLKDDTPSISQEIRAEGGGTIKCGNSLIGPDYFEAQLLPLENEEEMRRVNPFDWEAEFSEVFPPSPASGRGAGGEGGFDCVISNPPYIRIQVMKTWAPTEVEFYKQRYAAASKGNYDIYVVFVERALGLLNQRGVSTTLRGGFFRYFTQFVEQLPIRTINFDDPADVARHDKMVTLVERMLALHRKLAATSIPADKTLYQRQIQATDRQIDALAYELYGLTGEEIAIVEGRNH
jgi:hypothetical protein